MPSISFAIFILEWTLLVCLKVIKLELVLIAAVNVFSQTILIGVNNILTPELPSWELVNTK